MYGDGLWGASASKISRCTHLCRTASPRWKAGRRWGARSLPRGRRSPSWADSGRWSWRWCRRCRWQCSAAARSQCRAAASRARTGTPTRTSCPKTKDGGSCHWTGLCNNYPHKLRKFRSRPKDFWPKAEREFFWEVISAESQNWPNAEKVHFGRTMGISATQSNTSNT